MKHIHEEAQAALMKACDEMKHYADQHWGETPEYRVGQKVWIEAEDLDLKRPSKKLTERQIGPYPIVEIISPHAVKVKLPRSIKIHPVINVSRLRLRKESSIPSQTKSKPPPVEINGEMEYKVEQILDSRIY
jgi:glycosylphosphatidylinositol phospholipase D